jgi:hypothetical protein
MARGQVIAGDGLIPYLDEQAPVVSQEPQDYWRVVRQAPRCLQTVRYQLADQHRRIVDEVS